jgi:peptidoglycan hydrolase-like protein with peptidoglycan-binding domain
MSKRTWRFFFGAVLFLGTASIMSTAASPVAAQSSSTTTKKKKASSKSRKKGKVKAQAAPTPDRIKEIQTALQKDGTYQGEANGKWDSATADAMRRYQDKNGFPATGKIDALSLNKLGLGADTAGKGAPQPVASAAPSPSPAASPASTTSTSNPAPPAPADPPAK